MPYKDAEQARQRARERYMEIKNDPVRLAKRREQQKLSMRKWRKNNLERAREIIRKSQKKNYDREKHTNYIKDWRKRNPYNYERYKQREKERDELMRLKAIEILGGKCIDHLKNFGYECNDIRVLEGHHPNGRKNDIHAKRWWRHIEKTKSLIRLLCSNCHIIKHLEDE